MKASHKLISLAIAALFVGTYFVAMPNETQAGSAKSAADLEKEKAMQNPYPNDLGPEKLDDAVLKSYPADIQAGYKIMLGSGNKKNCQSCHTASRPLNSRFVEPEGKNDAEKEAAVAKLKTSNPEFFKNPTIWQVEAKIWNRYVKRMMSKPGCGISNEDGKKIWQFLVYDSAKRKLGPNAAAWKAHREKLIADFKTKFPERYKVLEHEKDL